MSNTGRVSRKAYESFANACVHGEPPACSVACPLNLDVREIVGHLQKGNFTAAYKAYRIKAVFPEIVAEVCDEPCKGACVRRDLDESISLRLLEKAAVEFSRAKAVPKFNLPRRPERVAVIGAGLAGITCAVRLAAKSYPVTIYEKSDRVGGRLWDLLDPSIFLPVLQEQLDATECEVRLGEEITALEGLEYEAIVVATGAGGETFGLLEGMDPHSFGTTRPGAFLIGNLLATTPVEDIAQGRIAAFSVEKYLKVGAMDGVPETFPVTRVAFEMDLTGVEVEPAVVPAARAAVSDGAVSEGAVAGAGPHGPGAAPSVRPTYDQQEAVAEAARCLLCDCNICSDACEVFGAVRRMPKAMVNDAIASLHSTKSGGAIRAMSSCNLCGLCGKVCPQGIDMGRFYRDFRLFKREDGLLPAAFHEFFLNDMRHANDEAYLALAAPGHDQARYVFFPGCQLAASDPRHVELTYHHLLERVPDMALILGCCGAPAEWGAEAALRDAVMERSTAEWERLGTPVFVFACATCKLQFERHAPQISSTSLYDLLLEVGLPESAAGGAAACAAAAPGGAAEACVFDPCSSRGDASMQQSVRRLADVAGINLTELPFSGGKAQCCGWGGHIAVANPKLLDTMVRDRTGAEPLPYVTYCANCQEVFSRGGKESRHILDIVLGLETVDHPPSLGQRRANRLAAKRAVLAREWGADMADAEDGGPGLMGDSLGAGRPEVIISEELLARMYADRVLEDDVYRTVEHCESTGSAVYDPERDVYIGHLRSGTITYWVEYAKSGQGIVLRSVYCHRAEILER